MQGQINLRRLLDHPNQHNFALMADLSANIRALRRALGLNQTEFGERLEVTQGTVSRWEKGTEPTYEHLMVLAELAGVSIQEFTKPIERPEAEVLSDQLVALEREMGERTADGRGRQATHTERSRVARVLASTGETHADGFQPREIPREKTLPVYGAAEGGNEGMIVTPEPIDWMTRPQAVSNAPDAFAVYVLGDSMEPRIEHGELVVVNPKRPVHRRNDVVLVKEGPDGTWHALVKRVLDWTKDSWLVLQYNPRKEFELPRSEWKAYAVTSRENA